MAGSPRFKIYNKMRDYIGSTVFPEDAARLVAGMEGATIRDGHPASKTVWTEGRDGNAGESYDKVARVVWDRIHARAWNMERR